MADDRRRRWVTFCESLERLRELSEVAATNPDPPLGARELGADIRDRRTGIVPIVRRMAQRWSKEGLTPVELLLTLRDGSWTPATLARTMGCTIDEAAAVLWGAGFVPGGSRQAWILGGDEAAKLIADDLRLAVDETGRSRDATDLQRVAYPRLVLTLIRGIAPELAHTDELVANHQGIVGPSDDENEDELVGRYDEFLDRRGFLDGVKARWLGVAAAVCIVAAAATELLIPGLRSFWESHTMTGALVSSGLVLVFTLAVVDAIVERRRVLRWRAVTELAMRELSTVIHEIMREIAIGVNADPEDPATIGTALDQLWDDPRRAAAFVHSLRVHCDRMSVATATWAPVMLADPASARALADFALARDCLSDVALAYVFRDDGGDGWEEAAGYFLEAFLVETAQFTLFRRRVVGEPFPHEVAGWDRFPRSARPPADTKGES